MCYAESEDGIRWTKPSLGVVEFQGSTDNNIIWDGIGTNNFVPFKATNPNTEGDATAHYLADQLRESGVKLSRIAYGMPLGGDLEYADHVTVGLCIENRRGL